MNIIPFNFESKQIRVVEINKEKGAHNLSTLKALPAGVTV